MNKDKAILGKLRGAFLKPAVFVITGFIALLFLTFLLDNHVKKSDREYTRKCFELLANDHLYTFQEKIQKNLYVLETIRAFYNSSENVYRDEFKSFVNPLVGKQSGIQMIAWAPVLSGQPTRGLKRDIASGKLDYLNQSAVDFQDKLIQKESTSKYIPLLYVEPAGESKNLLGFNLMSNPVFSDLLDWTCNQDLTTSCWCLDSTKSHGDLDGLVAFLPVYKDNQSVQSVRDRREQLYGFACLSINILDIINSSLEQFDSSDFRIMLYDLSLPDGARLVYKSDGIEKACSIDSASAYRDSSDNIYNAVFSITDNWWMMKYIPTEKYVNDHTESISAWILPIGISFSALITVFLYIISFKSMRVRRLFHALKDSSEKLQIDFEKRQQAEDALLDIKNLYRTTINAISDGIHVINEDLKIIMVNDRFRDWCRELNINSKLVGQHIMEAFPFLDYKVVQEYQQVFESGELLVSEEHTNLNGEEVVTITYKVPVLEDNKVKRIVTVVDDISQRKRREKLLRLTQISVEKNVDAAFWVKRDGEICYANESACYLLGYSNDEILSRKIYTCLADMTSDKWSEHWQELERWRSYKFESVLLNKHNETIPVEIGVNFVDFEGDQYNCLFARDLREINQARDVLENSYLKYGNIFENAAVAIAILNTSMEIVLANKSMRQAFAKIDFSQKIKCCKIFQPMGDIPECKNCDVQKTLLADQDFISIQNAANPDSPDNIKFTVSPIKSESNRSVAYIVIGEKIGQSQAVRNIPTA